jgi:hypothetical protein
VKIAIDMITDWSIKNKYGSVDETLQMLKSIEDSDIYLNSLKYQ